MKVQAALSALCALYTCAYAQATEIFPVIDLGYAKHAATRVNTTSRYNVSYATYANIRFAQPPVGNLRFRKPQVPPPSNSTVQTGIVGRNATDCLITIPPVEGLVPGAGGTSWGSEDCLFLDVKVPEGLQGEKVPVLIWYYGGGFFFGSKEPWGGEPAALFESMPADQKFITVSSNYRLGALGWLSPDYEGVDKNVAAYDALEALNWVREYIGYFGGDPDDITVIGESTGGGLVENLITAYGGTKDVGIKKAILTSPGYRTHVNRQQDMNDQFTVFMQTANCSDLACLQSLPTESIAAVNAELISNFNLSGGWIGPGVGYGGVVVDGDLVPDIPWRLLMDGKIQNSVTKVLAGIMTGDGRYVTVLNAQNWTENLGYFMKTPTQATVDKFQALYPGNFTESTNLFNGDVVFKCSAYWVAKTWGVNAYKYEMSIPPASHGQDQFYYFYGNNTGVSTSDSYVRVPDVAIQLQEYIRSLILDNYPGGGKVGENERQYWPSFGSQGRWMNITSDGFVLNLDDDVQKERCEAIWQSINNPADGW